MLKQTVEQKVDRGRKNQDKTNQNNQMQYWQI